jgi:hypothetical protein
MARLLIEERYTWPVRAVLLGGGGLRATSYQMLNLNRYPQSTHRLGSEIAVGQPAVVSNKNT